MNKNPRTRKFRDQLIDQSLRLSKDDRELLRDLSRVQFISDDIANSYHYQNRKTHPKVRLNKLVEAGLLKRHSMHEFGKGRLAVYEFANDELAKAWGGKRSAFGSNRTLQHELITSRLYFELGRPDDFRKENQFSAKDKTFLKNNVGGDKRYFPDALFSRAGVMHFAEADSGQYSKGQIRDKQVAWREVQQVWGQPSNAASPIQGGGSIHVFHF